VGIGPAPTPRVVVEPVAPIVDGGRFLAKASIGEPVVVLADVFADGHDAIEASVWVRRRDPAPGQDVDPRWDTWCEVPMVARGNDRWSASFDADSLGCWEFYVGGWIARFASWMHGTAAKQEAGLELTTELAEGAALLRPMRECAPDDDLRVLDSALADLEAGRFGAWSIDARLADAVRRSESRVPLTTSPRYAVQVEPERARWSSWYELFPRSTVDGTDRHGTLSDVIDRLPYVAGLGFDVLYLPPIHPIGPSLRKGRNNSFPAGPDDDGSPWGIGSSRGGHAAVHPELGTIDDVRSLAAAASDHGISLAIDIAFQCSPDHPWVTEHPDWFKHRPDGTIQYAENPPKRYQDVYPFDFESESWPELWRALLGVFELWLDVGVRVFRVDNPHTKPLPFWEWCIAELRHHAPDVVLLSEAFTRPRVMERLAKAGFSQSYTYFTWRSSKAELEEYLTELTTRTIDFLRPNLWPNTPDILTEQLQTGGRPQFVTRAVLASMLSANWGIYGPAFELVERTPVRPGSEEYLDSEKYQRRQWDLDAPWSIAPLVRRLNEIRRAHPALQHDRGLRFHRTDNDQIICFSKRWPADPAGTTGRSAARSGDRRPDAVVVVVNLDPHQARSAWLDVDVAELGIPYDVSYRVTDELGGGTYDWHGGRNWVHLDPAGLSAHVMSVDRAPETA
jgi:starch synthase (maltosyl-transferring)